MFNADPKNGLTIEKVKGNRAVFGANIMRELKPKSILSLVLEGVKEPMMVLLLSIAAISFIFGEPVKGSDDLCRGCVHLC